MAELCEATGADVKQLADAIGYDDRIGRKFLNAGLGFGGGCLPKDIRAFMARAGELGADQALTFLREVDNINMRRRIRMVELAREVCDGSLLGKRVAVLGAAFKPDSDDIRDSPALNVAAQLQLQGAVVRVTDPAAVENSRRLWPQLDYAATPEEAAERADAVLVLTEWKQYRELDPVAFGEVVAAEAGARRAQRARPRGLGGRRLDLPRPGPPRRPVARPPGPAGRDAPTGSRLLHNSAASPLSGANCSLPDASLRYGLIGSVSPLGGACQDERQVPRRARCVGLLAAGVPATPATEKATPPPRLSSTEARGCARSAPSRP